MFSEIYKGFPNEPILVKDSNLFSEAIKKWNLDYFMGLKNTKVSLSDNEGELNETLEIEDYIKLLIDNDLNSYKKYAAGWRFFESYPDMLKDFQEPIITKQDKLQNIPENLFKPLLWLFIGPDGSGTNLHYDTLMTHAWLAVISGKKRVALHPPENFEGIFELKRTQASEVLARRHSINSWKYFDIEPGEILCIPSGWWHEVLNEGITIGLSRNFTTSDISERVTQTAIDLGMLSILPWLSNKTQTGDNFYKYRTHPKLILSSLDNNITELSLPFGTHKLKVNSNLIKLLEDIDLNRNATASYIKEIIGEKTFDTLVKYYFLIPGEHIHLLNNGMCNLNNNPAGISLNISDIDQLKTDDVVLFHAPLVTGENSGISVARGGAWVRKVLNQSLAHPLGRNHKSGVLIDLDFGDQLHVDKLNLFDIGDVTFDFLTDTVDVLGNRVSSICQKITSQGCRPIILGGDHTLAYYTIKGMAEKYPNLGILHFDAHTDLYTLGNSSDTQLNHANVMHWVKNLQHVKKIWQIGIRDFYHQSMEGLFQSTSEVIERLPAYEAEIHGYDRLLEQLDSSIPWFISFDVDVLGFVDQPETSTPVLGGLSYYKLLDCLDKIFKKYFIVGIEFVEIGGGEVSAHGPAAISSRLISRFLFNLRKTSNSNQNVFVKQ
ncbi:arginase family protein [Acinetobacter oleivorans]|uniref:arginase family protein n=1 Tax=Acinetobacter oleivorans TaxID=1148157 RepID=UPI00178CEB00|nr:arginase family protein [Acinetobacter oleivorans]MBE2173814.1 arginase family protein [Acinetobacter oleivorans]MDY7372653.1 arginase family protein [Acinetobacter oleivorans]